MLKRMAVVIGLGLVLIAGQPVLPLTAQEDFLCRQYTGAFLVGNNSDLGILLSPNEPYKIHANGRTPSLIAAQTTETAFYFGNNTIDGSGVTYTWLEGVVADDNAPPYGLEATILLDPPSNEYVTWAAAIGNCGDDWPPLTSQPPAPIPQWPPSVSGYDYPMGYTAFVQDPNWTGSTWQVDIFGNCTDADCSGIAYINTALLNPLQSVHEEFDADPDDAWKTQVFPLGADPSDPTRQIYRVAIYVDGTLLDNRLHLFVAINGQVTTRIE